jgi:hypothetical protein
MHIEGIHFGTTGYWSLSSPKQQDIKKKEEKRRKKGEEKNPPTRSRAETFVAGPELAERMFPSRRLVLA